MTISCVHHTLASTAKNYLHPARVSRIISASRQAGLLACLRIVVGLKLPVGLVYQKASFIPPDPDGDLSLEELKRHYQALPLNTRRNFY